MGGPFALIDQSGRSASDRDKAETLRFARHAARRLVGDLDPALAGFA